MRFRKINGHANFLEFCLSDMLKKKLFIIHLSSQTLYLHAKRVALPEDILPTKTKHAAAKKYYKWMVKITPFGLN